MVAIAQCREAAEAHMIKGGLAGEGIASVVLDEHLVGVNWLYSDAVGGVKVAVRPHDRERALVFLRSRAGVIDPRLQRTPGAVNVAGIIVLLVVSAFAAPFLCVGIPFFGRPRRIEFD